MAKKLTLEKAREFSTKFPTEKERSAVKMAMEEFGITNMVASQAEREIGSLNFGIENSRTKIERNRKTIESLAAEMDYLKRRIESKQANLRMIEQIEKDWA